MELTGRAILIVGASSGIAAEAAVRLGRRDNRVGLVARRADRLETVAEQVRAGGSACHTWVADATDPDVMATVVDEAGARLGGLDVVWVNAGQGPDLSMRTVSVAEVAAMTRLNYDVLVNTLVPAIARLRATGGGQVVHTNSLAGLLGVPRQGPYGAAKAAAKLLLDATRAELAVDGIRVTSLYPGFVATERIADDGLPKPFQIDVSTAVDAALRAIETERADAAFPRTTATLTRVLRLLPPATRGAVLRRLARG